MVKRTGQTYPACVIPLPAASLLCRVLEQAAKNIQTARVASSRNAMKTVIAPPLGVVDMEAVGVAMQALKQVERRLPVPAERFQEAPRRSTRDSQLVND